MALVPCSQCGYHVFADADRCPHCGIRSRCALAPSASMLLLGLVFGGCGGLEDIYVHIGT